MHPLCKLLALTCLPPTVMATEQSPAGTVAPMAEPPHRLVWSAGLRLKMDDAANPGDLSPRPMIGLRYGRWRTGPVDGITWHRFGQIQTDNSLTYDWLDSPRWRTGLSASVVNLQKDSPTELLEPGRKTLRGKALIDYMGWSHWSVGLLLTQDLFNRGAGTSLSPTLTYRQALSSDSTVLLSQSVSWGSAGLWQTAHQTSPTMAVRQGQGWGSWNTSLTLRQRWHTHWSWFGQLSRNHVLGPLEAGSDGDRTRWSAQAGLIYFSH